MLLSVWIVAGVALHRSAVQTQSHQSLPSSFSVNAVSFGNISVLVSIRCQEEQLGETCGYRQAVSLPVVKAETLGVVKKVINSPDTTALVLKGVPITPLQDKEEELQESWQHWEPAASLLELGAEEVQPGEKDPLAGWHGGERRGAAKEALRKVSAQLAGRPRAAPARAPTRQERESHFEGFRCKRCGDRFQHKLSLQRHAWTHGDARLRCSLCAARFNKQDSFLKHLRNHARAPAPLACATCGTHFWMVRHLKMHARFFGHSAQPQPLRPPAGQQQEQTASPEEAPYRCSECCSVFRGKEGLIRHLRSHTLNARQHYCSLCPARFLVSTKLAVHMKRAHAADPPRVTSPLRPSLDRVAKCVIKQEVVDEEEQSSPRRKPAETKQGRYHCLVCFHTFRNIRSLKMHMQTHSDALPDAV